MTGEQATAFNEACEMIESLIDQMDWLGTGSSSREAAREENDARSRLAAIKDRFPASTSLRDTSEEKSS